jgi:hypothetical protein
MIGHTCSALSSNVPESWGGGGGGGQNGKTDAEMLSLCGICEVFSSPNNGLTNSSG